MRSPSLRNGEGQIRENPASVIQTDPQDYFKNQPAQERTQAAADLVLDGTASAPSEFLLSLPYYELPDLEEIRQFRRHHPSERIRAEIRRLLSGRRHVEVLHDHDILVSQYEKTWNWRHQEMLLRSKVFELMEVANVEWKLWEVDPVFPLDKSEGWLLVEEGRIVGATEFRNFTSSEGRTWLWYWLFVDPEYRRQGISREGSSVGSVVIRTWSSISQIRT